MRNTVGLMLAAPARGAPLAVDFADDQVNPAQLTVARGTVSRLPSARFVLLPGGWGHATIFHAEAWADPLGPFLAGLTSQEASR